MFSIHSKGSTKDTEKWMRRLLEGEMYDMLDKYGQEGVAALASATPIDEGETSASWYYEIETGKSYSITWYNRHVEDGVNIAIILQYGHGTGTGGYVQGRDYINPVIKPLFDRIEADVRKAVS